MRNHLLATACSFIFCAVFCFSAPITRTQLTDPNGAKLCFLSDIVNRDTPHHAIAIEADITGAKRLLLVVGDGGDNFGCDHVDWMEPKLVGPEGSLKLTDLKWSVAICGWQTAVLNRSVGGPAMNVQGRPVAYGIGTHSVSVLAYRIPEGYTTFKAQGGLDVTGTSQGGGATVQFAVLTGKLSLKQLQVLKVDNIGELTAVDLMETMAPIVQDAPEETAKEYINTVQDLAGWHRYDRFKQIFAEQAHHRHALLWATDRDPADIVFRRTQALLDDLTRRGTALQTERAALDALAEDVAKINIEDRRARFLLFQQLTALRRRIAFANPLLADIDKLLFVKRDAMPDDEGQGGHMCDQFFGHNATNGGTTRDRYGLFVLANPFTDRPAVYNLLENARVERGRLQGKKLMGGGYLSPDLSFDGREILFAYSEGSLEKWRMNSSFHIFKVRSDGTRLVQLTDGTANDFDPCFLPNGRIAFISERRGGFGRCHGRPVPSYTLHSMNPDGTDIIPLSPHETNEWGPSVDHNGMIIYTRWDYVDRGFNQAHHPWITYPDGRDSRAIHGNTRTHPHSAPFLENEIRAIPGSHKYTATASAHHGEQKGSLILIDPDMVDDNGMAPVKRITPLQLFPEAETRYHKRGAYATCWPLSEDYYLCVHDHYANGSFGSFDYKKTNYGIYLLDKFGNHTLLYRDPLVSCLTPIPLRPRPKPPVIPNHTGVGHFQQQDSARLFSRKAGPGGTGAATVGLLNVYKSPLPFPAGTTIKRLRIFQLLPKTTFPASHPRIGFGDQKGAKQLLGTVPVETDGSAYFQVPVGVPILFQAVGADGTAVQSMRSATYVKPGENLVCQGCHERRTEPPRITERPPKAFQRPPSNLTPGPDGSNPFSFARLVQPVLDKKCVSCHQQDRTGKAPDLSRGDFLKQNSYWFTSFNNLRNYCFYYNSASYTKAATVPGEFGARASLLYKMLKRGHHDLVLTPEEWERLIIWMDGNCNFLGSETDIRSQAEGKIVMPVLE